MKVKNLNNSAVKTKELIRKTFAEMLAEKNEISKISVTELVKRAEINRSTFYSHYDDIYGVMEDYENELINFFFDNEKLRQAQNPEQLAAIVFEFFDKNHETYRLLCKSDEALYSVSKIARLAENKVLEICHQSHRLKNKELLEAEICVFWEGLVCQFVRSCRGQTTVSPEELHAYALEWNKNFVAKHFE